MAFHTWEGEICDLGGLWFQTDNRGVCLGMGRACAAVLGGTPKDFLTKLLPLETESGDVVTSDDWRKKVELGDVFRATILVGAEGFSRARYDLTVLGWHDPQGVITGYTGSFSPQVAAVEEPKVMEEVFAVLETLLRDVPHAIFWKDRTLAYRGASTFFAWCAGFHSPHDLIGKRDRDLTWTPEEVAAFEECEQHVLETGEPMFHRAETQRRGSGEKVQVYTHRVPLRGVDGSVVGVLGVQQELPDVTAAEGETASLEQLLGSARVGYWEWNFETQRVNFSTHCALALGYTPSELQGSVTILDRLVHPDDRDLLFETVEKHVNDGQEDYGIEIRLLSKAAGWRVYRSSGKVIEHKAGGGAKRLISVLVDINEAVLKSVEREGELQAELAKAQETGGLTAALLSRVSHAVRSSVDGILGMTRLLSGTELSSEQHEYVQGVDRSAEGMVALIEESLDVVRLESGEFQLRESTFKLDGLLLQALRLLQPALADREVEFSCSLEGDVPEVCCGDKERLERLLLSLCANSLWLMERGDQGMLHVTPGSVENGIHNLMFRVTRTQRDSQSLTPQRRTLAAAGSVVEQTQSWLRGSVAHRLLKALGGSLSMGESPDVLISFSLPLKAAEPSSVTKSDADADDWVRPVPSNGSHSAAVSDLGRVLLVEDNAVSQKACRRMLEKMGFVVAVAEDGREALDLLAAQEKFFSLVLLDCDLPRVDGFEVTRTVREREKETGDHLPIVALTGQALDEERERCFEVGMDDYLMKPVSLDALKDTVSKYLQA